MKIYVGNTDSDWITHLRARSSLAQVNFWFPSPQQGFQALHHGGIFLFKTKAAAGGRIVGGAIFDAFVRARISDAWQWFGPDNGVASLDELRARVRHYRRLTTPLPLDAEIGCVLLDFVSWFPTQEQLPMPNDWAANIVRGRTYETADLSPDHSVVRAVARYLGTGIDALDSLPREWGDRVFGDPVTRIPRLGQKTFAAVISENYRHRCAITGDKVRPVLEAAHILPVAEGGIHRPDNGLLLRSDIHTLYDSGYMTVDPKHRLIVSPQLREEFGNGDALYARAGSVIALPERRRDRPHREFLEWHMETVFRR